MKTDIKELKKVLGLDVKKVNPVSIRKDKTKLYYIKSCAFPIKGFELAKRGIPESEWKEDRWGGWQ